MNLTIDQLTLQREKNYFLAVAIISILGWIVIAVTIFGLFIGLGVAFFLWLFNGLMIAYLKTEAVKIDEKQMPALYSTYIEVCLKLQVSKIPDLYVIQSSGALNAFATRHSGRDFVVLYSDIVEAYDQKGDEIRYLLGHELGHVKSKHLLKHALLFPGFMLPLVGPGYSRACEASCDRHGAFACQGLDGAIRALMILFGGKELGKLMDPVSFADQYKQQRGFFVSWHEVIWPYPTASERVASLIALRDETATVRYKRNPLSYVFGFFSFGIHQIIGIYLVVIMAAVAMPNLLKAKLLSNDTLATSNIKQLGGIYQDYVKSHQGQAPTSIADLENFDKSKMVRSICGKTISGFIYTCNVQQGQYDFIATPLTKGTSGSQEIAISSQDTGVNAKTEQTAVTEESPTAVEDNTSLLKELESIK